MFYVMAIILTTSTCCN